MSEKSSRFVPSAVFCSFRLGSMEAVAFFSSTRKMIQVNTCISITEKTEGKQDDWNSYVGMDH
jgi:hypothetical protein